MGPWMLALLLSPPASAASADACKEQYKPEYQAQWEISRSGWDESCDAGWAARETLRGHQSRFLDACRREFAKSSAVRETVSAYCAQGVAGRRRLKADLGFPPENEPAAAAPPPPSRTPGENAMGPLGRAIEAANLKWGRGTCFSALVYWYRQQNIVVERGTTRSKLERYAGQVEAYYYYFHSNSNPKYSDVVGFADTVDPAFCTLNERLHGPLFAETNKSTGWDCLTKVEVDLGQVLKLATGAGLAFNGADGIDVQLLSRKTFEELVPHGGPLSGRQKRAVAGKELWVVTAEGKQAFIDASEPKLLFVRKGAVRLIPYRGVADKDYGTMIPYHGEPCR